MLYTSALSDIQIAKIVAAKLPKANILEAKRLTTGGKNFVFWLSTNNDGFVIRMITDKYKKTYEAAIYWKNRLLPLGAPLAKFIAQDLVCFGDPLFVLGLTYVALESLDFDTIYCDTWAKLLKLDQKAQLRLDFYRLFYTTWFMRHHADVVSDNGTVYNMNTDVLKKLFLNAIDKMNEHNKRTD